MQVNDETIKFRARDQTIILDIVPELIHSLPNTILKISSPNRIIVIISATEIRPTIRNTGLRLAMMVSFLLYFSDIR
jgi:hypothetical protein